MKRYICAVLLVMVYSQSFAQAKLDSLQILKDVNGGDVVFTPIAANVVTFGNGFGTNNMAFITALRNRTIAVLPITLSSFKPLREANSVKLLWKTSSEINSAYFEVLKSTDGKNFTKIEIVKAAGNSNQILSYSFRDVNPAKGSNYYQLNMVDIDGTAKKSIIVSANFDIDQPEFNVFPDANKETLSINIYSNKAKPAVFIVFDLSGDKLLSKNLILQSGINNFQYKFHTSAKIIIAQLDSDGNKQVKKLFY